MQKITKVPDIKAITREMTSKSQIRIVIDRFNNLDFLSKIIFLKNNLIFLPKLVRKDFSTGIKILCEIEILKTKKKSFILDNQVTDMAIALKNKDILKYFFYLAKKYSFIPTIQTYNLKKLINFLSFFKKIPSNLVIYFPDSGSKEINLQNLANKRSIKYIKFAND